MIYVSHTAQIHFINLLKKKEEGTRIRIFVDHPGTLNAKCGISFCPQDTIKENDIALKFERLVIYIDRLSAPYLEDAEIDCSIDKLGSYLTLKAPNVKIHKSLHDDPLMERIREFLKSKINPKLADHGGWVSLIEITDYGIAILQFSGGCSGCPMVKTTLKEGIEKYLLKEFSELKGVRDINEFH